MFAIKVEDSGLAKKLQQKEQGARKALACTMKELKKRAPGKVADAVTDVYAIKKGAITPGKRRMAGRSSVRASGESVGDFALVYTGSPLTPTRFNMSPKAPPGGGRRYTLKATFRKGNRVTIGHWAKPYSEGGAYARPAESPYFIGAGNGGMVLPFQRKGDKLSKVFRTVSVPQMVGNEEVAERAIEEINDLARGRLEHNLQRFLNG